MLRNKNLYLLILAVLFTVLGGYFLNLKVSAGNDLCPENDVTGMQLIEKTVLLPFAIPVQPKTSKTINVIVTAYSSTVEETDSTPFITASGEPVCDGIVANNLLPFGTKIRLPAIFGDRIFVVKDRMHWKKGNYHVDVWFQSTKEALNFGSKYAKMEVLLD